MSENNSEVSPWLTTKDAAKYLSIAENTLRCFVSRRRIPFAKNRGIIRFHREKLDEWLFTNYHDPVDKGAAHRKE